MLQVSPDVPNAVGSISQLPLLGAGGFGFLIGWYVYYINRHRKADVQLNDLVTLVGVIGGGAVLALFPAGTALFGAYGIGLFTGFLFYFTILVVLVLFSKNFTIDWFLDGRKKVLSPEFYIPEVDGKPVNAPLSTSSLDPKNNTVG